MRIPFIVTKPHANLHYLVGLWYHQGYSIPHRGISAGGIGIHQTNFNPTSTYKQ